jgi:tRNA U34 5-carboxymethylaminomethyl modifying enzyme MnmG/GidA
LRRPETHSWHLFAFDRDLENLPKEVWEQMEIQVKYDGYIKARPGERKKAAGVGAMAGTGTGDLQNPSGAGAEFV